MTATRMRLADGRWHWQHGPIDLVIGAHGDADAIDDAHAAAWRRFGTILDELVAELPLLRRHAHDTTMPTGLVARRMWRACRPHAERFVTPMAAVAGAVADEVVAIYRCAGVRRAWVNDGGDIALHLAPGETLRVGVFADLARFDAAAWRGTVDVDGRFAIASNEPVRGIATSGWRGRSFSMGIADSVTVLARDAAEADAAATMIANAVDVDDVRIVRRPAVSLKDDSDLGDRLVTVDVPPLDARRIDAALAAGIAHAETLRGRGLIDRALLVCQGRAMVVGGDRRSTALDSRLRGHDGSGADDRRTIATPVALSPTRVAA